MNDEYYDFEFRVIDGKLVSGFCYKNAASGWSEIFVEMTSEQCAIANQFTDEFHALRDKQFNIIKSWLLEQAKGVSYE